MSDCYALGFKPSSKKKQKKNTSAAIGPDIIGSRNYTEYCVLKIEESEVQMNNQSEVPTQVVEVPTQDIEAPTQVIDLIGLYSQNSKSESNDNTKCDSSHFAYSSDVKATEPVKGE